MLLCTNTTMIRQLLYYLAKSINSSCKRVNRLKSILYINYFTIGIGHNKDIFLDKMISSVLLLCGVVHYVQYNKKSSTPFFLIDHFEYAQLIQST